MPKQTFRCNKNLNNKHQFNLRLINLNALYYICTSWNVHCPRCTVHWTETFRNNVSNEKRGTELSHWPSTNMKPRKVRNKLPMTKNRKHVIGIEHIQNVNTAPSVIIGWSMVYCFRASSFSSMCSAIHALSSIVAMRCHALSKVSAA